jgi:Mg-chelatase subunit ChlD
MMDDFDDHNSMDRDSIDRELEVRLMNWVMGEASDFERDQLQLLMEQRVEVADYFQHLEHLHNRLCEVGRGELLTGNDAHESDDAWQLSSDRRERVLAILDGTAPDPVTKLALASETAQQTMVWSRWWLAGVAATAAGILLCFMLLPSVQLHRSSARYFQTEIVGGTSSAYYLNNDTVYFPQKTGADTNSAGSYYGMTSDGENTFGNVADNPVTGRNEYRQRVPSTQYVPPNLIPTDQSIDGRLDNWSDHLDFGTKASEGDRMRISGEGRGWKESNADSDSKSNWKAETVVEQGPTDYLSESVANGNIDNGRNGGLGSINAYTVRVPNEEANNRKDDTSTLMMTVTPRIHIEDLEEEYEQKSPRERGLSEKPLEPVAAGAKTGTREKQADDSIGVAQSLLTLDKLAVHDNRIKDSNGNDASESADFANNEIELKRLSPLTSGPDSMGRAFYDSSPKPAVPKRSAAIDEQTASAEAFSTFSLHVSDVSFKLAQTALSQGQLPDASKIRIEEFVNAMDYHDPLPCGNERVACRIEQAIHPFLMQRNLLRVSMRTAATGRSINTPLRLTLLVDNSGSMERIDRRRALQRAFQTLTAQLTAADQVTLISFASTPRLLADKVPGNQSETLLQIIEKLPSEGGTNIEAALLLAREKGVEQKLEGAQNRIVLMTDGAVNLGNANPNSLAKLVTEMRDSGISFDAAGISAQDLNDEVLEALARRGDGRYYLLDSSEAASDGFAAQIAGALRPSAQNVKVQVEFNPQRVGRYKLLGFEKHRLNTEDFRNDQVDAAEMAAAEAGVAVYQFEIKPNGNGDIGSVSVRFRDLSSDQMIERRWPIPYERNAPRLEQAEASMQLAATAALFAAKLSGGPLADSIDLTELQKLFSNLSGPCASQPRVQQLRSMIDQAKAIGN